MEKSDWKYETIMGSYPVIEWNIWLVPDKFEIKVVYEQEILPDKNGAYRILYAMATGRFLEKTYSKQCIAEVKLEFESIPSDTVVKIASVPPPDMIFETNYTNEVESRIGCLDEIVFRKASKPFGSLEHLNY